MWLIRLLKSLVRISIFVLLVITLFGLYILYDIGPELVALLKPKEGIETIVRWQAHDKSFLYDRDARVISEYYNYDMEFIPYKELPTTLVHAIVAVEDKNFWFHNGYDFLAMLRAFYILSKNFLFHGKLEFAQGASTITQQVVRHLLLSREKKITRKIKEIILASEVEKALTKEQIFEIYTNTFFMGEGAYGVGAASKRYFAKPLPKLSAHELVLLAGLFQSPSALNPHKYPDRAKARQLTVLKAMVQMKILDIKKAKEWSLSPLIYEQEKRRRINDAPFFADYVEKEACLLLGVDSIKNRGYRIYTTIDMKLQKIAEEAINEKSSLFDTYAGKDKKIEAALLVTDPQKGEILAMVGGRDYSQSQFNRTVQAKRQPGSLFKPIVYSYALQRGFKWSDVFYVSPINLEGEYRPRSQESEYMNETTLLRAFYRSINASTLELAEKLGLHNILEHAKKFGITSPLKPEYGSAIGASEISMLELAKIFGVFANAGEFLPLHTITRIEEQKGEVVYSHQEELPVKVLSKQISFLLTQAMVQVLLRGTGAQAAQLAQYTAGKTGTTNDSKDNWFAGYSPNILAIAWVGNDQALALAGKAQGSRLGLPLWVAFMEKALKIRTTDKFLQPSGVSMLRIDPINGARSDKGVPMWFIEGNEPSVYAGHKSLENGESLRDPFTSEVHSLK